jgi:hypothetical protein
VFHYIKTFKIKKIIVFQLPINYSTIRNMSSVSGSKEKRLAPLVSLSPFSSFRQAISSISKTQEGKNVEINYTRIYLGR